MSQDTGRSGMPGAQRLSAARSAWWSAVENGGLALLSFAALVVYARLLSPSDFGLFSIVLAAAELLGLLVGMLYHDALVQRREVTARHFDTAFTASVALGLLLWLGCWLLAPQVSGIVGHPQAGPVLAWTALAFPCAALSATIVAQQRRELAFRSLAWRSLAGRLAGACGGIALVVAGAGVWGLAAQHVLTAAVGTAVLWWAVRSRPSLRFDAACWRELIGFGAAAVGTLMLNFAVKRLFVILAGVLLGTEAAGYLNLAFRAVDVFWAIAATAVTQVALPVLSRLQADPARLRQAWREAAQYTCLALYPCFVGLALLAPEVVELLFGARWLACAPYVSALSLLVVVQAPRLLVTPALTALGHPRRALIGPALELAVVLGLIAVLGVPTLQMAVAIWAARELLAAPCMAWVLQRTAGIAVTTQWGAAWSAAMGACAMAVAVLVVRTWLPPLWDAPWRLAVLVPTGACAFIVAAWLADRRAVTRLADFAAAALGRPTRTAH